MNNEVWFAVKLSEDLHIIEVADAATSGIAHRKANEFTDAGFKARVVPPEDANEFAYYYDQICQKREMGFIGEYGVIPNGTRKNGDGARTIGNMIYPAFGGMLEGSKNDGDVVPSDVKPSPSPMWHPFKINLKTGAITELDGVTPHVLFSSKETPQLIKKPIMKLGLNGLSK
jgi:hypothetical protein